MLRITRCSGQLTTLTPSQYREAVIYNKNVRLRCGLHDRRQESRQIIRFVLGWNDNLWSVTFDLESSQFYVAARTSISLWIIATGASLDTSREQPGQ